MSVSILYYKVSPEKISSAHDSGQIMTWISELPVKKQRQVLKLRQPQDRYLSLAGLQLLKRSIPEFSAKPFSLADVQFPPQAKPCIPGNLDFNISHSGEIVCCAVSDTVKVGIDIEYQRPVYPGTIKKILDSSEPAEVINELDYFFSVWTKKEAIIKAANAGSVFNLHEISLTANGGEYLDHSWYCYPLEIISDDPGKVYTCHVACSSGISDIRLKQIHEL